MNKLIIDYPDYKLNSEIINKIVIAINYYDIGTYLLPRNIDKASDEYKKHTIIGCEYIESVLKNVLDKDIYNYALEICKYHHEKFDGTGIHSLSENNIPIYIQIIILAIECSNMLIKQKSLEELYNSIINKKGKKYNPIIVELFEKYYKVIFN